MATPKSGRKGGVAGKLVADVSSIGVSVGAACALRLPVCLAESLPLTFKVLGPVRCNAKASQALGRLATIYPSSHHVLTSSTYRH
jgi:hypothetical protein